MRYTVPGLLLPCDWSAGVTWPAPGFWLVETESRSTELRPSTPMLSISSESSLKISRIYESLDSLVYHRFPIKNQQKIFYFPSSFWPFSPPIIDCFSPTKYFCQYIQEKSVSIISPEGEGNSCILTLLIIVLHHFLFLLFIIFIFFIQNLVQTAAEWSKSSEAGSATKMI